MGLWVNRIQRGFNRSPTELKRRAFQELKAFLSTQMKRFRPCTGIKSQENLLRAIKEGRLKGF